MIEFWLMNIWIVLQLELRGDPGILRSSGDILRMELMRRLIVAA